MINLYIKPIFKLHYQYPNNMFIRCKDWNSVYDVYCSDRLNIYGRTGLMTNISTMLYGIKQKAKYSFYKWSYQPIYGTKVIKF